MRIQRVRNVPGLIRGVKWNMAASSAVTRSGQISDQTQPGKTGGKLGEARSAPSAQPRLPMTAQEAALLSAALCIALLALSISIIARVAPAGGTIPLLGIGLLTFAFGGIAGSAIAFSFRRAQINSPALPADTMHLLATLDTIPNGIAVWDRFGHLIRANGNYASFLDLPTVDQLLGAPRDMIKTVHGKSLTRVLDRKTIKNGLIENKKGSYVLQRMSLGNGDMIEMLSDISILKDREGALGEQESQLRAAFKEMSGLRATVSSQSQDIESLRNDIGIQTERAEIALRSKSEFLAHMSHELRTPLNAILGFSDMMRGQVFGPMGHAKYDEYADDIHSSGQDLLSLISDILDVSQIQSGDVPIDRQRIDLEKTIVDCLTMLRPRIYASGLSLIENIDRLPPVLADPMAIRQIILHILSNAMKFTQKGGRISIKAEIDLEHVTIIIDDTGIGIEPEVLARLDEPFAATDQNAHISGESEGLGVGIPVSKSLARLNGGSLDIQSETGFGTTVRIQLPRR